jgi:branched-chain amino acid transport system permease protein
VALAGAILGYLVWPARVDTYSKFWMPLLGAALALFIRSIVVQIVAARKPKPTRPVPPMPADTTVPVARAV